MSTEAQLAPAAGAGIGKILADRLLALPDFVEKMQAVAIRCLSATQKRWIKETNTTVEEPDLKIQSTMFFGLLAHMEGEPIKRIIHQHLGAGKEIDPLAALQESPALREAAKAMLEKAEWRTSGHQKHKRPKAVGPTVEAESGKTDLQ